MTSQEENKFWRITKTHNIVQQFNRKLTKKINFCSSMLLTSSSFFVDDIWTKLWNFRSVPCAAVTWKRQENNWCSHDCNSRKEIKCSPRYMQCINILFDVFLKQQADTFISYCCLYVVNILHMDIWNAKQSTLHSESSKRKKWVTSKARYVLLWN